MCNLEKMFQNISNKHKGEFRLSPCELNSEIGSRAWKEGCASPLLLSLGLNLQQVDHLSFYKNMNSDIKIFAKRSYSPLTLGLVCYNSHVSDSALGNSGVNSD